jgi:hypothetical protein
MGGYDFDLRCRPSGDFRIPEMIDFLDLVREAFKCSVLYDSHSRPVNISEANLQKTCDKEAKEILPGCGVNIFFYTIPPQKILENRISVEIHTGTDPGEVLIDSYSILIGDKRMLPDFEYFERSIEIFKPFEGFLADDENEFQLRARDRQREIGGFTKPAVIRGLHYLDKDMARSIGGINYCLKAPAWHVDKFCEGVLIDLVPGVFDSTNPEHLEAQQKVMAYFDML